MDKTYQIAKDDIRAIQDDYIEGEGYERHPLDTWYALDFAINCMNKLEKIEQVIGEWNDNWQSSQKDLWMYLAEIKEILEQE